MLTHPEYYAETVVFVLDVCEDPGIEPSKHAARLELLKQCIGMFAQAKSRVNAAHKYGLAVIRDTVQWESLGITSSPEALAGALRCVHPAAAGAAPPPPLDLGDLVALVQPLAVAEAADGCRVRVVLVYCRSTMIPVWTTKHLQREGLCLDVLFVHDKAAATAIVAAAGPAGCNTPQDVYTWLEDNVDELSGRYGHHSYIFEAGGHLTKKVINHVVSLVAHPSQRPPQRSLRAVPLDLAAMPPQPTAATAAAASSAAAPNPLDPAAFPPVPGGPTLVATAAAPPLGGMGPAVVRSSDVPSQPPTAHGAAGGNQSSSLPPLPLASQTVDLIHFTTSDEYPLPPPPLAASAMPPPYRPPGAVPGAPAAAAAAGATQALAGLVLTQAPVQAGAYADAPSAAWAAWPSEAPAAAAAGMSSASYFQPAIHGAAAATPPPPVWPQGPPPAAGSPS